MKDSVGLRPGRTEVRVEAEVVKMEQNDQIKEQKVGCMFM